MPLNDALAPGETVGSEVTDNAALLAEIGADTGDDHGGNAEHEFAADGPDGQPEADSTADTSGAADEWKPPTREEWEAQQAQLEALGNSVDPEIDRLLKESLQKTEAPAESAAPAPGSVDQSAIEAMMQPRTFAPSQEVVSKILIEGDADAFAQYSKDLIDTVQHNARIDMNNAILKGIKYAQPIQAASAKFYDKYPELVGLSDYVEEHMWDVRGKNPAANEMLILRTVEKRLAPVILRARQIAQQAKGNASRTMTPAPAAGGSTPSPRPRTQQGPSGPPSVGSRMKELAEYAAQTAY